MSRLPKIIDNDRRSLLEVFQQVAPEYNTLSIATGYWDLKGMQMMFEHIKHYTNIRLLIGREPLIPRYKQTAPEPDYPDKDFFYDLEKMQPTPELRQLVSDIKTMISEKRLEVRVYRKNFLHAKCYIFGDYQSENAVGIIGSSNFTGNGLTQNTELNALESDHRVVAFQPQAEKQEVGHLFWFDQFWHDRETEEWNGQFTELLGTSPVGDLLFSPYETYIKTLYELYKEEIEDDDFIHSENSSYSLYEFQQKNVQALKRKLQKNGIAMLSDSVGLGKTITALEVLQSYKDDQKRSIVICPKSLVSQWERELMKNNLSEVRPITLQNADQIEKEKDFDKYAGVSLFVIDESHNLRNTAGNRYESILEWIRNNPKAHVLLLTATPINNQLSDLVNQILLGTRGMGNIFSVLMPESEQEVSFVDAIAKIQKEMKQRASEEKEIDYEKIRQVLAPIIRQVVVRRTRQGILQDYGGIKTKNGEMLDFPKERVKKQTYSFRKEIEKELLEEIEEEEIQNAFLFSPEDIVEKCTDFSHPLNQLGKLEITPEKNHTNSPISVFFQLILLLGLVPYRWRMYNWKYYQKTVEQIKELRLDAEENRALQQQRGIYGIFRTIFLKRLESSVFAIKTSLESYLKKLEIFEQGIDSGKIVKLKFVSKFWGAFDPENDSLEDFLEEEGFEVLDEKIYQVQEMKADISKDKKIIEVLLSLLQKLEKEDAKLTALLKLIHNQGEKKVLIFSYFSDTISYLKNTLPSLSNGLLNEKNSFFLSSANRKEAEDIVERFAPKAQDAQEKISKSDEIQYLFATDVLSEGQNLQDCGVLINYDLHWNPVRMIQRNGRINRLGSEHSEVFVYNMSPEERLESYLKLVKRLEGKIDLIRFTIGTDQSVLGEMAKPTDYIDDISDIYSDDEQKSFKALQNLENAGDFLLAEDVFVKDLQEFFANPDFSEDYKKSITEGIAKGKWGVFPASKKENIPEILSFNKVQFKREDNTEKSYLHFLKMDSSGNARKILPSLLALSFLKTSPEENQKEHDKISKNKKLAKEIAETVENYKQASESVTPKKIHQTLLQRMQEIGYSFDDILAVRDCVLTKNVLDQKALSGAMRKIASDIQKNAPHHTDLENLVKMAYGALGQKDPIDEPVAVENLLFYAKNL